VVTAGWVVLLPLLVGNAPAVAQAVECPDRVGGVPLESSVAEEGEPTKLFCYFVPEEAGEATPITIVVTWAPAGSDPAVAESCGNENFTDRDGDRWSGFRYGDPAAASVWFQADDLSLGDKRPAIRRAVDALLEEVAPLAADCSDPPPGSYELDPDFCGSYFGAGRLVAAEADVESGFVRVVCDYEPTENQTSRRSPVRLEVEFARPEDESAPACGLPPELTAGDGRVTGVMYGGTEAIRVTWTALDPEAGYGELELWGLSDQGYLKAAEEAAACPDTADGHDLADGLPPWASTPPMPSLAPELGFYTEGIPCPSIPGFDLRDPAPAWPVGNDWINLDCEYVRTGVEAQFFEAAEADRISISADWNKENGRTGRYCRDQDSVTETDTAVFGRLHDERARSLEVGYAVPKDAALSGAVAAEAEAMLAAIRPIAYVCPDRNEIAFDPIPPSWQGVLGSDPPPPPIRLPDEVTAADLGLEGEATAPVVTTTAAPPEVTAPTSAQDTAAPPSSAPRSGVWRVLGIAGLVLSIAGVALALLTARKRSRVRPKWDAARLGISALTIGAMTLVVGIATPVLAIAVGLGLGALLGFAQGRSIEVAMTEKGLFARRSIWGVAFFGLGVVLTQVAGLANRAGVVALGLGVGFLSVAMTAGLIAARRPRIAAARRNVAALLVAVVAASLLAQLVSAAPTRAQEQQEEAADPVHQLLLDLVDWDEIQVVGGLWATQGKPLFTVSIPPGFEAPPEPFEHSDSWRYGESGSEFEITETFTFSLRDDGACCDVDYAADGTRLSGETSAAFHVEGRITGLAGNQVHPLGSRVPFDDPELYGGTGLDPVPCGRPTVTSAAFGADTVWTSYAVDGEEQGMSGGPELHLLAPCELPGFTLERALPLIPPPPPADAEERFQGENLGPCPVLQEILLPIAEAGDLTTASAYTMGRLLRNPNQPACDAGAELGMPLRGEPQIRMWWKLASTTNPDYEAGRLNEINNDFISRSRQYNIYDEDACELDADGEILPPPEGEECFRSQFFSVGSEVAIWVEYVDDGPNVEIRGRLPWGSYWFYCHHCEPSDRQVRNALGAFHRAASSAAAASAEEPPAPVAGDDQSGEEAAGEETGEVAATEAGDDDDIDARDAAIAALIGLLGVAGLLGATFIESGVGLVDALRTGGDEVGAVPEDGIPADAGPLPIYDQWGNELTERDDGMVAWVEQRDDGMFTERWVTREEAEQLSAQHSDFWRAGEVERLGAGSWEEAFQTHADGQFDRLGRHADLERRIASGEITSVDDLSPEQQAEFPDLVEHFGDRARMSDFDRRAAAAENWLEEYAPGHLRELDRLREAAAAAGGVDPELLEQMAELARRAQRAQQAAEGVDAIDWDRIAQGQQFTEDITMAVIQGLATAIDPTRGWVSGAAVGGAQSWLRGDSGGRIMANAALSAGFNRLGVALGGLRPNSMVFQTGASAVSGYAEGYVMSGGSHEAAAASGFLGALSGSVMTGAQRMGDAAGSMHLPARADLDLPGLRTGGADVGPARVTGGPDVDVSTRATPAPEGGTRVTPAPEGGTRAGASEVPASTDTSVRTGAREQAADLSPLRPREELPDFPETMTPRQQAQEIRARDLGIQDPHGHRQSALFGDSQGRVYDTHGNHIANRNPETGGYTDLRGQEITEFIPSREGGYGELYGAPQGYRTADGTRIEVSRPTVRPDGTRVPGTTHRVIEGAGDPTFRADSSLDVPDRAVTAANVDRNLMAATGADYNGNMIGRDGEVFGTIEGNQMFTTGPNRREIIGYGGVREGRPTYYTTADGTVHWTGELSARQQRQIMSGGAHPDAVGDTDLAGLARGSGLTEGQMMSRVAEEAADRIRLQEALPVLRSGMDPPAMEAALQRQQWNDMVDRLGPGLPRFET
jgi:hypothetical protein